MLSTTETLLTCSPSTLLATRKRMELTAEEGNWRGAFDADKDRGGGLALGVSEQAVLRHDDHDAGGFHLVQLADGAGQFALDGAGVIGALHEIGDAEIGLVENLESHPFAAGNALAGHLHAHLIDLVGGNEDGAAAAADLVGDLGLVQGGDDLGGFALVQFAVEQGEIGAAGPKGHAGQAAEHGQGGQGDADALVEAELFPDARQLLQELREVFIHDKAALANHTCMRISSW